MTNRWKVGIHGEQELSSDQWARYRGTHLPVYKTVWPIPALPGIPTVSRIWIGGDAVEATYISRGVQGARDWFNLNLPILERFPGVIWDLLNEPDTSSPEKCRMISIYLVELGRLMHSRGFLCGGPSVGEGRPEGDDAARRAEMRELGPGICAMDYFTFHGYWAPPTVPPEDLWHCLRYRMNYRYLREEGFNPPPGIGTEAGIDAGVIGRGRISWIGLGLTAEEYLSQIDRFNTELNKDPDIIGMTIYGLNPFPMWEDFRINGAVEDGIIARAEVNAVPEEPIQFIKIDGRYLSYTEWWKYLQTLDLKGKISTVVIHHTGSPDKATWDRWGGWSYWKDRLIEYYRDTKHWDRGPHGFIDSGGIGIFTPLGMDGIGVSDHNIGTRHLELVGDFSLTLPESAELDLAHRMAAALLERAGLGVDALSYHNLLGSGESNCPGATFIKFWPMFREMVISDLGEGTMPQEVLEKALGDEMQKHIIPLNPTAALEKAGSAMGLLPAGEEFDITLSGRSYRVQAYRSPGEREWQFGLYALVGDWRNIRSFRRLN